MQREIFSVFFFCMNIIFRANGELRIQKKLSRIGISVCEYGGNIGDAVDAKAIIDAVKNWDGVAVVIYHKYLCSKPAQEMILEAIKNESLERVVVASCTPKMHMATFQRFLLVEMRAKMDKP